MIGKNKEVQRFVRGHIYEITYTPKEDWLYVCQFRRIVKMALQTGPVFTYYSFGFLATSLGPYSAKDIRISLNVINNYSVKELQVTDLPLYLGLHTYPLMEKILSAGKITQTRKLKLSSTITDKT